MFKVLVRFSLFISFYFETDKTPWEVEWTAVLEKALLAHLFMMLCL